jgi:DNA/RNA endonuclease YhcR with UshA esterase domain
MPLSPQEAVTRINEKGTVEMLVKAAKNCQHCLQVFLDSEADHHDPTNLAVAITKSAQVKFIELTIDDPAKYFKGKAIRVTGTVILREHRPQIEIDDPDQITVV